MNITETIIYLTEDIENIQEKTWLKPALISHVSHLTKKPEKLITIAVDTFFNNPEKYI
mgnify:CR=1 FL=1|jgi:hypothetical protein|tara:strand:+ start:132 stop:305 length:174 start_codon:yes stop_codon:yes gene_type:complete